MSGFQSTLCCVLYPRLPRPVEKSGLPGSKASQQAARLLAGTKGRAEIQPRVIRHISRQSAAPPPSAHKVCMSGQSSAPPTSAHKVGMSGQSVAPPTSSHEVCLDSQRPHLHLPTRNVCLDSHRPHLHLPTR